MQEFGRNERKTPWHLWVVGIVSLLWNAGGAFDHFMTMTRNAAYMGQFTPEQLVYFYNFPIWADIAWTVGVWGSVAGSVLLLLRSRFAVAAFGLSIAGLVVTTLYNFVLTDGFELMGGSVFVILFSAAIWLVTILLFFYARAMRARGVIG